MELEDSLKGTYQPMLEVIRALDRPFDHLQFHLRRSFLTYPFFRVWMNKLESRIDADLSLDSCGSFCTCSNEFETGGQKENVCGKCCNVEQRKPRDCGFFPSNPDFGLP